MAAATSGEPPAQASAVLTSVLPRYFGVLEPAKAARTSPSAEVTVTLVRWPYT